MKNYGLPTIAVLLLVLAVLMSYASTRHKQTIITRQRENIVSLESRVSAMRIHIDDLEVRIASMRDSFESRIDEMESSVSNRFVKDEARIKKLEYDMPTEPQDINYKLDDLAHRIMGQHIGEEYIEWSMP